jgi:hypothetical protein
MSQIVPGGHPNAQVTGLVIQEIDQNQNIHFQWRSWDHFEITDATPDIDLTAQNIDYCHGNAMKIDQDGDLLISCRNMDEITKIDRATGEIIWRFGKYSKNNQFAIYNDPTGFSHQHDIRVLTNGNYTIFDNGNNHFPQVSQALEYEIDEENMTATRTWTYRHDPDIYAFATGSHQRTNTNRSIIGWGWCQSSIIAITEVEMDGEKTFELELPSSVYGYRTLKYSWNTNVFKATEELEFGQSDGYGYTTYKNLQVTNTSNQNINITSVHNHLDEFYVNEEFPILITPGQSINIKVYFNPLEQGYYDDVLTLNYDNYSNTERIARQTRLYGYWDEIPPAATITPVNGSDNITLDTIIQTFFNEPVRTVGGGNINSA